MTTTTDARDRLRAALYRTGRPQYDNRCETCAHCVPAQRGVVAQGLRESVIPHDDDQQQWKLMPVTPTPEMLAAVSWPGCAATDYAHMLAAAPQPPSALAEVGEALRRHVSANERMRALLIQFRAAAATLHEIATAQIHGGCDAGYLHDALTGAAEIMSRIDAAIEEEK